ncbi:MAG: hypothetical protein M1827_006882 [Pycnora praestabilis]|nr:MAG: hypothetical protein M1827_006882 [Pycnora praestabilis]
MDAFLATGTGDGSWPRGKGALLSNCEAAVNGVINSADSALATASPSAGGLSKGIGVSPNIACLLGIALFLYRRWRKRRGNEEYSAMQMGPVMGGEKNGEGKGQWWQG